MASLNFLVHRLFSFPLSKPRFDVERTAVYKVANVNGYDIKIVDKSIRRHKFKLTLRNATSFQADKTIWKESQSCSIPSTQGNLVRFSKNHQVLKAFISLGQS
ncbi:unnamed protein product [Phaedon cochleariae]|uniref:Uncharacterized protein n=1 Tax=Phaedon cochleariae TaxID=80249 RepID=A0A9N9SM22_PHACE|nr:unnamed protein product [Phaedon cochleariae]